MTTFALRSSIRPLNPTSIACDRPEIPAWRPGTGTAEGTTLTSEASMPPTVKKVRNPRPAREPSRLRSAGHGEIGSWSRRAHLAARPAARRRGGGRCARPRRLREQPSRRAGRHHHDARQSRDRLLPEPADHGAGLADDAAAAAHDHDHDQAAGAGHAADERADHLVDAALDLSGGASPSYLVEPLRSHST